LFLLLMDRGDESNFVACDIKHSEFPNLIGVRKKLAQLDEVRKSVLAYERIPTREGRFRVRMFLLEFIQALPSNDVHYWRANLSQTFSDEKPLLEWSGVRYQMSDYHLPLMEKP
jgi:hypothetical protein